MMTVTKEHDAHLANAIDAEALAQGPSSAARFSRAGLIAVFKADTTTLWSSRPIRERIQIRRAIAAIVLSQAGRR